MFTLDGELSGRRRRSGTKSILSLGFTEGGVDHCSKLLQTISGADIMRPELPHATHYLFNSIPCAYTWFHH